TLTTESTLNQVLKGLSVDKLSSVTDYEKLLQQLVPLIKSFDFFLNILNFSGKLKDFCRKLTIFNEISRTAVANESTDLALARCSLFDISFLMLFYITQHYGKDSNLDFALDKQVTTPDQRQQQQQQDE